MLTTLRGWNGPSLRPNPADDGGRAAKAGAPFFCPPVSSLEIDPSCPDLPYKGVATPFHGQRIRTSETENSKPAKLSKPKNSQQNSDPNSEPEKPANSEPRSKSETWKHRGSASQNTERPRCNVLPLQSGGASPSLEVKAMEWHNFAEILFGLAAVITALKQGGKKK
ncbi:hypothetical protein ACQKE8_22450 [Sphingobium limneticum]|uniref:hypothetical protein n=1 Tax=Sphingobium limneticum TaxID=1007511 RepID=UPI003D092B50